MKFSKERFDNEAALIEREKAVLSSLRTTYGPADLGPTDTEPNLLGNIKTCLNKYEEIRLRRVCNADLLATIHQKFCLYRLLVPEFYGGPLRCIEDLRTALAALRERKKPGRKDGGQAGVPRPVWKIYDGLF
jgi:hypothetical protein